MNYLSKITYAFLCIFVVLVFVSCENLNPESIQEDQEEISKAVAEISEAQQSFSASFNTMNEAVRQMDDLNGFTGPLIAQNRGCDNVELVLDPINTFPALVVMDFGDNCTQNGHSFTGKMEATFNGSLFEEGKGMMLTFTNYTVDGYGIQGIYEVRNQGNNANNQFNSEHTISAGMLTDQDGNEFSYSGVTTSTLIEGQETDWKTDGQAGLDDDVWQEEEDGVYVNLSLIHI